MCHITSNHILSGARCSFLGPSRLLSSTPLLLSSPLPSFETDKETPQVDLGWHVYCDTAPSLFRLAHRMWELLVHQQMDVSPTAALRVELKVIETRCCLRTRVAPDRLAKPLRLARFQFRIRTAGLKGGLGSSAAPQIAECRSTPRHTAERPTPPRPPMPRG